MIKAPRQAWLKGVPSDLKMLIFMVSLALIVAVVYMAVGQVFAYFDSQRLYVKYNSFQDYYTSQPTKEVETNTNAVSTPENKQRHEDDLPGPLGYVHPLIVILITAIIAITLIGFIFFYLAERYGGLRE
jgi:hypothetical protein